MPCQVDTGTARGNSLALMLLPVFGHHPGVVMVMVGREVDFDKASVNRDFTGVYTGYSIRRVKNN